MTSKLVFIGGIHGVGKSTFCEMLEAKHHNLERFSASNLIKSYKSNAYTTDKKVEEIIDNQNVLVNAFNAQKKLKDVVLLDGHFCLFDNQNNPQIIPKSVFQDLKVQLFILLTAPIDLVLRRIESRDKITYLRDKFIELQNHEIATARKISLELGKPLIELDYQDINENCALTISKTLKAINQ